MTIAVHHLPVKAIMEGPSACFRLLEVESQGMKHAEYIGLLLSATDNRLAGSWMSLACSSLRACGDSDFSTTDWVEDSAVSR